MAYIIYILIIILIIAQIVVVSKTRGLTHKQEHIFENDANEYKVENFYIPKKELATITYNDILENIDTYSKQGDSYETVESEVYDAFQDKMVIVTEQKIVCKKRDKITVNLIQINPTNEVSQEIQRVTNNYLLRNRGAASDYGLIKDIVERNCDSIGEEIETQTPWPLYFGLMGTMAGIIIGIGSIGLNIGFAEFVQHPEAHIGSLMGDVAVAMLVSFCGIGWTTYLSYLAKQAKTVLEDRKNSFYSWFQAELMPIITKENASAGLKRLEENLDRFNESFETNVKELNQTFSLVKSTSHDQAAMLSTLEHMDLAQMATANVAILTQFNETVGKLEGFTKYIDYAKTALDDIQSRNNAITEATISVDTNLDKVFAELKEGVEKQVNALKESLAQSGSAMEGLVEHEQTLLKQQGSKIDTFFNTIQDLKPIITGLNDWKKELQRQTAEIGRLAAALQNRPYSSHEGISAQPVKNNDKLKVIIGSLIAVIITIMMFINMFYTIKLSGTLNDIKEDQQSSNIPSDSLSAANISTNSDVEITSIEPQDSKEDNNKNKEEISSKTSE